MTILSTATPTMVDASLWIGLLGLLVTVFISVISLAAQGTDKERTGAA
jgi:hypothetical protein